MSVDKYLHNVFAPKLMKCMVYLYHLYHVLQLTNMVSVPVILGVFFFKFSIFWVFLKEQFIQDALVGYEMNIANKACNAELAIYSIISFLRHACSILLKIEKR